MPDYRPLLIAVLLAGCQPISLELTASPELLPLTGCDQTGKVVQAEVEDTSRGYPYSYNIYLPPCYQTDAEREYPILYLMPGRGSGPTAWFASGADKAADTAILDAGVPPFVIVATENTDSDSYADAILNDLIPYIESHYPILEKRNYRAVAGGSLGGIAAYRIAFQHPEQFASSALFGSGLISGEESQFNDWLEALPAGNQPRVFLNTGEQDSYLLERARVMAGILEHAGIETTLIVSEGDHNYSYWISNFPAYLSWLAKDW